MMVVPCGRIEATLTEDSGFTVSMCGMYSRKADKGRYQPMVRSKLLLLLG